MDDRTRDEKKAVATVLRRLGSLRREIGFFIENRLKRPSLFRLGSAERLGAIYREPSCMCVPDRVMIYALVRGLRPSLALEIGVRWGNSGRIIANAMEDNRHGRVFGLDPETAAYRQSDRDMHGRYRLIEGRSPEDVPKVAAKAGAAFEFVFIDGLHTHDAVLRDYRAVEPFLAPEAYVVFHDAFHQGIDRAISQIVADDPTIADLGILSRHPTVGDPVSLQGLRVIVKRPADGPALIATAAEGAGLPQPIFDECLNNYGRRINETELGATREEVARWEALRARRGRQSEKATAT